MFANLFAHLTALLTAVTGRKTVAARGANFIEYALLAAVAVVLFILFKDAITGIATNIFGSLTASVDSAI